LTKKSSNDLCFLNKQTKTLFWFHFRSWYGQNFTLDSSCLVYNEFQRLGLFGNSWGSYKDILKFTLNKYKQFTLKPTMNLNFKIKLHFTSQIFSHTSVNSGVSWLNSHNSQLSPVFRYLKNAEINYSVFFRLTNVKFTKIFGDEIELCFSSQFIRRFEPTIGHSKIIVAFWLDEKFLTGNFRWSIYGDTVNIWNFSGRRSFDELKNYRN